MKTRIAVPVAVALVAGAFTLVAPTAQADAPWDGTATGWAGTSTYDGDEWIHQDFVYDDYGANTGAWGQPNVISLVGTTGDYRYPDGDTIRDNAADIVEVRVRPTDTGVVVRVTLSTLLDPDVPALLVRTSAADGTDVDETVVHAGTAGAEVDAAANTITFPLEVETDRFGLNIGAGLRGANGLRQPVPGTASMFPNEVTSGGPTRASSPNIAGLFDLAFNTEGIEGRSGGWNEDAQSNALNAGAIDAFAQVIDIAALRSATGEAFTLESGYHVGILTSRQAIGEGMSGSFPQYRSQYQPFAVWVPADHDPSAATPFYLSMHSLNSSHNQYRGGSARGATYATYYEQLGDDLGALIATPLGRGPDGWYEAEALVDTLEVWAEMQQRFSIDADRVYAGGYSMGGYGTYRLTTMMPDAFASAAVVVGPPTNGIWAYPLPPEADGREDRPDNTYHQLESTRHVPTSIKHGTNDELVPVSGIVHQARRYDELGHEYQFNLFPGHDHLSFAVADGWAEEAVWLRDHETRIVDPARITLDIRPSTWVEGAVGREDTILALLDELTAEIGADLEGGYWVDDVTLIDETGDATGTVDITSHGAGTDRFTISTKTAEPGANPLGAYVRSERRLGSFDVIDPGDAITGDVRNVRSLTIDVGRAGLGNDPDVSGLEVTDYVLITFVRGGEVVGSVIAGDAPPVLEIPMIVSDI